MNGFETELKIIDRLLSTKHETGKLEPEGEQKLLAALEYIRAVNFGTVSTEETGPEGPVSREESVTRRLDYLVEMMETISAEQADIAEVHCSLKREQRKVSGALDRRIPKIDPTAFIKGFGLGMAVAPITLGAVLGIILIVMHLAMKIHVSGALIGSVFGCSAVGAGVFLYGACKNQRSLLSWGGDDWEDEWEGESKW